MSPRRRSPQRVAGLVLVGGLALAACGSDGADDAADSAAPDTAESGSSDGSDSSGSSQSADGGDSSEGAGFDEVPAAAIDVVAYSESAAVVVGTEQIDPTAPEVSVSGLRTWNSPTDDLPPPTIDLGVLRSGGPPPDGIPSIDEPVFHDGSTVDYLAPTDPVVAVEINGDARAYPLDIMIWHEIVNDTVGGVPVSVAYCPLCNSVTVYESDVDGQILEFGVSGLLYNSSLVMYDRQTETLWSHFTGEPLYGELVDSELVEIPATIVGFGTWLEENPDGLVLSRDTGFERRYGANPYPGYDDVNSDPFLFEGDVDGRYTAMTRVVGVEDDGETAAFPLLELREAGVVTTDLGGAPAAAFWVPGSTSALDGGNVSGGVDVGATGVFRPVVDGQTLTFESAGDGVITDVETGSTWNVFGEAIDGELAGSTLDQLTHIDTFWFAWIAFHPDSTVAV
ncbi:MAG: DUF3179 domain-containing protein [Actinomycetota bacterium]